MIPESFRQMLDEVKKEIGAKSDSEVIRRAYKLLKKLGGAELRAKLERAERKIKKQASARRKKRATHARGK